MHILCKMRRDIEQVRGQSPTRTTQHQDVEALEVNHLTCIRWF
jgi:hypothetical protein